MTDLTPLFPRQKVPAFDVPLLGGGTWSLSGQSPERFSMVVVYRGLHCPICRGYLKDLDNKLGDFADRGTEVVAISSDDEDRAARAREEWHLGNLAIGYGLGLGEARSWGLYISTGIGKTSAGIDEPPLFVEPGLFLIRPDQTLYFASVQTMPFARPQFGDVLKALDTVIARDYPARGEVLDHTREAAE